VLTRRVGSAGRVTGGAGSPDILLGGTRSASALSHEAYLTAGHAVPQPSSKRIPSLKTRCRSASTVDGKDTKGQPSPPRDWVASALYLPVRHTRPRWRASALWALEPHSHQRAQPILNGLHSEPQRGVRQEAWAPDQSLSSAMPPQPPSTKGSSHLPL
jgi:hypothetical protein